MRIQELRTGSLGQGIGHGTMVKRTDETALFRWFEIACRPDRGHPCVSSKHGVSAGQLAERGCHIFRTNRSPLLSLLDIDGKLVTHLLSFAQRLLQERVVLFL